MRTVGHNTYRNPKVKRVNSHSSPHSFVAPTAAPPLSLLNCGAFSPTPHPLCRLPYPSNWINQLSLSLKGIFKYYRRSKSLMLFSLLPSWDHEEETRSKDSTLLSWNFHIELFLVFKFYLSSFNQSKVPKKKNNKSFRLLVLINQFSFPFGWMDHIWDLSTYQWTCGGQLFPFVG